MVGAPKQTVRIARKLRQNMSLPEMLLWRILRERPGGWKFRKQHPIGRYVLDFFCAEARVAIEIDGITHEMGNQPARDDMRDLWLSTRRIEVIRIPARDVLAHPEQVGQAIMNMLECKRP